jgi:hypothetical protein
VYRTDAAATNGAYPLGYLVEDIAALEHWFGLILELLSLNSFLKISLVTAQDFMVSFVRLECAPFDCSSNIQLPITINNDAHSRLFHPF